MALMMAMTMRGSPTVDRKKGQNREKGQKLLSFTPALPLLAAPGAEGAAKARPVGPDGDALSWRHASCRPQPRRAPII